MATLSAPPPASVSATEPQPQSQSQPQSTSESTSTTTTTTSLLAGLNCRGNVHLILGTNPLAATRATQSLSAGAHPVLVAPSDSELHYSLQQKVEAGLVKWERRAFDVGTDLDSLGRAEVDHVVDAVFVTTRFEGRAEVARACRRRRIPVNVVDAPELCTFTLLSTHVDGPLQVGVTTNGRGCKLASRIRREIAASLPRELGAACARLGEVRRRLQEHESHRESHQESHQVATSTAAVLGDLEEDGGQGASFNRLVLQGSDDGDEARTRRMRWLSQVCEYWPLRRLASVTDADVDALFSSYPSACHPPDSLPTGASRQHKGLIILAGSGPGHPDLLTQATLKAIHAADLILADKLVPAGVLDLIPRRTPVHIARKFPGNADLAQQELLDRALAGYRDGKTVLRLKQGDPFVYGRGGEEVLFFRGPQGGVPADRVVVLPGVTSALSAPLFGDIPATQRDVADQVLVCTGTGKKGKPPSPPEFVPSRTVVFLMALHRIQGLVTELTTHVEVTAEAAGGALPQQPHGKTTRALWPLATPCAVIERASCPDQRIIRTSLRHVAEAIEAEGSRPPGLLVVGASCEVLHPSEKGRAWVVEEGFRGLDIDQFGGMASELAKLAA